MKEKPEQARFLEYGKTYAEHASKAREETMSELKDQSLQAPTSSPQAKAKRTVGSRTLRYGKDTVSPQAADRLKQNTGKSNEK